METTSREVAQRAAEMVVALEPDCTDALAVLATLRRSPEERIERAD